MDFELAEKAFQEYLKNYNTKDGRYKRMCKRIFRRKM